MRRYLYPFGGALYLYTEDDAGEHRRHLGNLADPWTSYAVDEHCPELYPEYETLKAAHLDAIEGGEAYAREARTYR